MASNADTLIIEDFSIYNEENPLIIGEEYTEVYFNGSGDIEIEQLDATNDGLLLTIAQGANVTLNNFSVSEEAITLNCEGTFVINDKPTVTIRLTDHHFEANSIYIPLFQSDNSWLLLHLHYGAYRSEIYVLEDGTIYEPGFRQGTYYKTRGSNGLAEYGVTVHLRGANIPEPTTASLSLLALAGLAARRRRK